MDFVRDQLADGRRFRTLDIADDQTPGMTIEVNTSLGGVRVVRVLDRLVAQMNAPKVIVVMSPRPIWAP